MAATVRFSRNRCKMAKTEKYIDNNCVENGIMLRADLHRMFDRFFWSIYPKTKVVVVFVPILEMMQLHGMKVKAKQGGFPPMKICQWHWDQCVVRCIQGFQ
ncbi:hypothetical protein FN846DRAFT_1001765 [Sphaerosporella brunnea]|uniref:HNH nuclease domain-containing protein n=1 Tax=Sphaerosporella brunnea TaxID=1250544 RepID=A0A5J5EH84_9PEZI|nr:hypothetical protein FN846DRAFT_1001765 [Sphaerosporella brunnea]